MQLFYYKQGRRQKEIENDKLASDSWRELYEQERKRGLEQRDHYEAMLDKKQERVKELRDEVELHVKSEAALGKELAYAQYNLCVRRCANREPPREELDAYEALPAGKAPKPETDGHV